MSIKNKLHPDSYCCAIPAHRDHVNQSGSVDLGLRILEEQRVLVYTNFAHTDVLSLFSTDALYRNAVYNHISTPVLRSLRYCRVSELPKDYEPKKNNERKRRRLPKKTFTVMETLVNEEMYTQKHNPKCYTKAVFLCRL